MNDRSDAETRRANQKAKPVKISILEKVNDYSLIDIYGFMEVSIKKDALDRKC